MDRQDFDDKSLYIIGIGGIGMSAIAEILHVNGYNVKGSDIKSNDVMRRLESMGVAITIGHSPENLNGVDVVIRSTAIKEDHVEIQTAKARKIKVLHRSEALALLLDGYKTVAITGTHGKSTTTALVGHVCIVGGLEPTVVNGAVMNQFSSNVVVGSSKLAVIESDESDGSFLRLPADLSCITNMDPDHLEQYGTVEHMEEGYEHFIHKVIGRGLCFVCNDHAKLAAMVRKVSSQNFISYGIESASDISGFNIRSTMSGVMFDFQISERFAALVQIKDHLFKDMKVSIYGKHNVLNTLASIGICLSLGIDMQQVRLALQQFQGVKRRFTAVGMMNGAKVIDDYAHHPVEVIATLSTAKEAVLFNGRVIAVFQPHRYSRTSAFMQEFATAFQDADLVILTEIYGAHEEPLAGVTSAKLASNIDPRKIVAVCSGFDELKATLHSIVKFGDIIVMMGAGDITNWSYKLVEQQ